MEEWEGNKNPTFLPWGEVAISCRVLAPLTRGSGSNPAEVVLGLLFRNLGGGGGVSGSSEGGGESEKAWWLEKPDAAAMAEKKPTAYGFAIVELRLFLLG